jgi:hypothetical protein
MTVSEFLARFYQRGNNLTDSEIEQGMEAVRRLGVEHERITGLAKEYQELSTARGEGLDRLRKERGGLRRYARKLIQGKVYCETGNVDGEHVCEEFTAPARGTCDLCAELAEAVEVLGPDWWKPVEDSAERESLLERFSKSFYLRHDHSYSGMEVYQWLKDALAPQPAAKPSTDPLDVVGRLGSAGYQTVVVPQPTATGEGPGDGELLDAIERMARACVKEVFGENARCGFLVSLEGDVLSGTVKDYPHNNLRDAIRAAMKEKSK